MALPMYITNEHRQFLSDMRKADRKIIHYEGYRFWKGPAVIIKSLTELEDICLETRVRVRYDVSSKGYVVHPEVYGEMK